MADFFIYTYKLEDEASLNEPAFKTRGYGFNTKNEPVLLTMEDNYFRPWLSIEIKDTVDFNCKKFETKQKKF